MKKLTLLSICLCAPLLMANTGCSSGVPVLNGNSVNQSLPGKVSLGAEKALTAAHQAYNGLGSELILAASSGILKGQDAANAKAYYDRAGDTLLLADKAEKAADETTLTAEINDVNTLISQAKKIAGVK